jgi:hypothetical protein
MEWESRLSVRVCAFLSFSRPSREIPRDRNQASSRLAIIALLIREWNDLRASAPFEASR